MIEPTVDRSIFQGDGKIIVAKIQEHIYPSLLARIGQSWIFIDQIGAKDSSLVMGDSLIQIFKVANRSITTGRIRRFLFIFGLTLQNVFDDNLKDTTDFITEICDELTEKLRTKENVSSHTIRNLKEWADSLLSDSSKNLKGVIENAVKILENLPTKSEDSTVIALQNLLEK